jgi:hypothetical protein
MNVRQKLCVIPHASASRESVLPSAARVKKRKPPLPTSTAHHAHVHLPFAHSSFFLFPLPHRAPSTASSALAPPPPPPASRTPPRTPRPCTRSSPLGTTPRPAGPLRSHTRAPREPRDPASKIDLTVGCCRSETPPIQRRRPGLPPSNHRATSPSSALQCRHPLPSIPFRWRD